MADLSQNLIKYLKSCGHAEIDINKYNLNTKLYHDLGVYGDIAYEHLQNLEEQFGVDLSTLVFEEYFPNEFPGQTRFQQLFRWFFPWLSGLTKAQNNYKPITLSMLEVAISGKKWVD